ncbi:MAG: cobyric acid synthase [Actinomycetota bacterium]|nr:cobyric acid synthase [Actinomycetota bacterium]
MTKALRPMMVLGCTSDAGKSWIATGLCRWFARRGVRVVPFKAQNMSNNARVVDGGEIGVAQWLQALAARVEPTVLMNPVLLKPEAETRSQVVVNGRPDLGLTNTPWRQRGDALWPAMVEAFDELRRANDLVVVEGAGSPAEINLQDLVNNRMIDHADAAGLLVADIDRGGAFAHLFGTWSLVPTSTQRRLAAFVLNRFRGDAALLAPAPALLTERTGMAHAGTVPMVEHQLPAEEGLAVRPRPAAVSGEPRVAILRFPFGSNLDEFHLLGQVAAVSLADHPAGLVDADLVILPGSKHVAADLAWMRARGLDTAIVRRVAECGRVLAICGGAQMVGESVDDPDGIEGGTAESTPGLGLLPLRTVLHASKVTARIAVTFPVDLDHPWRALAGVETSGYEIRHGRTGDAGPLIQGSGSVLVTSVHGLLEDPVVVERLLGRRPMRVLEPTFELLADVIDEFFDTDMLLRLVGAGRP